MLSQQAANICACSQLVTSFRACSAEGQITAQFKIIIQNMLSIREMNFIAGLAYADMISMLAEHTQKCLKVGYLSRIEYNFQHSRGP
jgi:hypothetical protein